MIDQISKCIKVVPDFPKQGVHFYDIFPVFQNKEATLALHNLIVQNLPDVDYIIAPETRGLLLAMLVLPNVNAKLLPMRKKGKLPGKKMTFLYKTEYSYDSLEVPDIDLTDKKVFFIDDIYATGGTYRAAKQAVSVLKGELVGGLVLYSVLTPPPKGVLEIMRG